MKAYKCDRCKEYYDTIVSWGYTVLHSGSGGEKVDLCPACKDALVSWIEDYQKGVSDTATAENK